MLTWMYNWDSDTYHFSTSAECPIPYCTYGYCDLSMKQEDYSLTIFDIQVLYLPSFSFLEAIEYNEISKEETEKRYSFLKRTDL